MISYVDGRPVLTCPCGSQWWVTGTDKCWECGREATSAEIEEYEEACREPIPVERNDKMYCMLNYNDDFEIALYYKEVDKTFTINIRFGKDTFAIYGIDIEGLEKLINKLNRDLKRHVEAL